MDDLTFRDGNPLDGFGVCLSDYRHHAEPYEAIEAERLRRGANPFEAMVFTCDELEAVCPESELSLRSSRYSGFRDDFEHKTDSADSAALWADQDREFDRDWFRERSERLFRLCTAFEREAKEAGLVPVQPDHAVLRIARFSPNDAIPLHRVIEVRCKDIATINAASDASLEAMFSCEPGSNPFVAVGRCGEHYETDFDKRGCGNSLTIVRNPPRKIELQRSDSRPFNECSELLNLTRKNEKDLPKEHWLIPGAMLAGSTAVFVAPGGTGKSVWSLQLSTALGRGEGSAMGVKVTSRRTKVWVINREDDPNQQRKRVAAICKLFGYDPAGLQGWVHLLNTNLTGICLAKRGPNGQPIEGPDVQRLAQYVLDNGIGAVIIDPLVAIHVLKESDNDDMRFLLDVLARIAKITGAAIYIVHHSNKPSGASAEGRAGDANSARGASDIINAPRIAKTMYPMPQSEAKKWGVPPETCHRYVRIDDAKANHSALSGQPHWFEKVTVRLDNGEDSFALKPVQLGNADTQTHCDGLVGELLKAAIGRARDSSGKVVNFSPNPKAQGDSNTARWLMAHGAEAFTVEQIRQSLKWIEGTLIRVADYKSGGKRAQRYELC